MYRKFGQDLKYALTEELPAMLRESQCDCKEDGKSFFAILTYMHVKGYIDISTINDIMVILKMNTFENKMDTFLKRIHRFILKKFDYYTIEELCEALNDKLIPAYYYSIGYWLIENASDFFEYDGYIYYILKTGKMFFKIDTHYMKNNMDIYEKSTLISSGYEKIYGFDETEKKVYLKFCNIENITACYEIEKRTISIIGGKFITLHNNLYIITDEGYLEVIQGKGNVRLREVKDYENYIPKEDGFLVSPYMSDEYRFFYPYMLTYEGKINPPDQRVINNIIWKRIDYLTDMNFIVHTYLKLHEVKEIQECPFEKLTINNLKIRCKEPIQEQLFYAGSKAMLLRDILKVLEKYVDGDEDISMLLSVLIEINHYVNKSNDDDMVFPSTVLHKEIMNMKSKNACMFFGQQNYDGLKEYFKSYSVSNSRKSSVRKIGIINRDNNGKLIFSAIPLSSGVIIGSQILPKNIDNGIGTCSYDLFLNIFYISSKEEFDEVEKRRIRDKFGLTEKNVRYVLYR